jgi:hypothetical protein
MTFSRKTKGIFQDYFCEKEKRKISCLTNSRKTH